MMRSLYSGVSGLKTHQVKMDVIGNNIVCFPNGNWLTNKAYYNSQKVEYFSINGEPISEEEIKNNTEYTNKILDVSNNIIVFNLLASDKEQEKTLQEVEKGS